MNEKTIFLWIGGRCLEWFKDDFIISDDIDLIQLDRVSQLLSSTYWGSERTTENIKKGINHSLTFSLYHIGKQIGFARVITDRAVFSWILDVVVAEGYRGNGLGKWLIECILEHPEIENTAFALATSDAQDFYKKFRFKENVCMTKPYLTK